MAEPDLPEKIVVGFEQNERGEDALALGRLLGRTLGVEPRRVTVDHGSAAKELFKLVERAEADLLVLGSTHRAAVGRVTPGSVAERLLDGARCRLAIAPRGYAEDETVREEPRVIAAGFDGTPSSRAAVAEAAELAARVGASMRIVSVSEPIPPTLGPSSGAPPLVRGDLQEVLHDAVAELPGDVRALPVHERGDAAQRLLEQAGEGVDLLVLGSRGFGPVMRLMLGSVSARVIREAPCPVLVVPSSR